MIFTQLKKLFSLFLLVSLFTSSISLFAQTKLIAPDQAPIKDQVTKTREKDSVAKPTTQQLLETIDEDINSDNTLLIKTKDGEDVTDTKNEIKDKISKQSSIKKDNIKDFDASDDQVVALQFDDKESLKKGLKIALENDKVEIAQPNYHYKKQGGIYTPNDPDFLNQWYLTNQVYESDAQAAWQYLAVKNSTTCGLGTVISKKCGGDPNIKVAVIDSGVNTNVADFAGTPIDTANSMMFFNNPAGAACPANETYIPANGLYVGWQFCQRIGSQFDEDGHGTGVASVISAQDNNIGGVGIAYNTTLLPIALHNDTFNTFFISEAIKYAQARGAKVINLSLGTPYYDSFLESTINSAVANGMTVVASSGNCAVWTASSCDWDGSGTQNQPEEANNTPMYPAAFSSVIGVGASNYGTPSSGVTRACYSNYGSYVDVVAPVGDTGTACHTSGGPSTSGVRIICGVSRSGCPTVDSYTSGYGTSYSAPMVAAAAALALSIDSGLNPAQVKDLIEKQSTDGGLGGRDNEFGFGVLNLGNIARTLTANYTPIYYFPWYDTKNGNSAYTLVGNPSASPVDIKISIKNTNYIKYATIPAGGNLFYENVGILTGPVVVATAGGASVYASQRAEQKLPSGSAFNEVSGILASTLTNKYYFPWYDTLPGNSTYILVGNPSTTIPANIQIKIAGNVVKTASIAPGDSLFHESTGLIGGPVEVTSDINIYTTQRTSQKINGYYSFNEFPGIAQNTLTNKYYFPWYDTLPGNSAYILIGNPSTTASANIQIKIAGNVVKTATILPGKNLFSETTNIIGGPVEVTSDINVYTTQRVNQKLDGKVSFNEYAGISATTLTNKYYFPWYDTLPGNSAYILIGNPSTTASANIQIKIAGNVVKTATILPGKNLFSETTNIIGGPVEVTSDINVYTTHRVEQKLPGGKTFNEFEGIVPPLMVQ